MHKAKFDSSPVANFRPNILILITMLFGMLLAPGAQAADPVGALDFTSGDVSIKSAAGVTRNAAKGDDLMQNELVVTGGASIAVLRLADDSKMVLRPNSEFRVKKLDTGDQGKPTAILNLLRGGLRLITGLIGKKNPRGYRLSTPVATIGIRGTEFNTRLCGLDCAAEEKALAGSDAAAKIKEGLYVNVDDGDIYLRNFASDEPLELDEGESGYVSDLDSVPVKLAFVPAFQQQDKLPSPDDLDYDDIEIPDDTLSSLEIATGTAVAAAAVAAAASGDSDATVSAATKTADADVAGTYEIDDISYTSSTPLSDRKWFFGANPDIEFELTQDGDNIGGEFEGDRDGRILKGKIDGDTITIDFYLEALGGEIKDGTATWTVGSDGSLTGDFNVRDQQRGVVRGLWTLIKTD